MLNSTPATPSPKKRAKATTSGSDAIPQAKKQRQTTSSATSKKSQYFEETESAADADKDEHSESSEQSAADEAESDFEAEDKGASSAASDELASSDDSEGDYSLTEDEVPKRKKRPAVSGNKKSRASSASAKAPTTIQNTADKQQLWREGALTDLEPGTEIIIKKPKARPAGKTAYKDDTIHPNTMLFLADLKANNDREWLKSELSPFFPSALIQGDVDRTPFDCWIRRTTSGKMNPTDRRADAIQCTIPTSAPRRRTGRAFSSSSRSGLARLMIRFLNYRSKIS